jgi:hypothetical protein
MLEKPEGISKYGHSRETRAILRTGHRIKTQTNKQKTQQKAQNK